MELRLPDMQLPTSCHVSCIRAALWPAGWGRVCPQSGDPFDAVVSDHSAVRRGHPRRANVGQRQCCPQLSDIGAERLAAIRCRERESRGKHCLKSV